MGAAERQLVPRHVRCREPAGLEAFLIDRQRAADHRRRVHDDDRRAARVGVEIDQSLEPNLEAALLACFPESRLRELLAAIDVAARKYPLAVAGLDGPLHKYDAIVGVRDD